MNYKGCFGGIFLRGASSKSVRRYWLAGIATEGKDGRSPLHRAAASPLQYRGNDAAVHPLRRNHYKVVMNSKTNF